jgi:hypothetical protein
MDVFDGSVLDYEAFVRLQKEAFREILGKRNVSDEFMRAEYYRWKYHTPVGYGRVAAVMDGPEMISVAAMLPVHVRHGEAVMRGWQCLDVATLPGHRGKGHFFDCLQALKDTLESNEIFFAFPNENSLPGFIKLGCYENLVVTTWINPLALGGKPRPPSFTEVASFDGRANGLFEKLLGSCGPVLDRNSAYMNYRYPGHPNNQYVLIEHQEEGALKGCAVVRKAHVMGRDVVLIMELWGLSSSIQRRLLRFVAGWSHSQGVGMAVMMHSGFLLFDGLATGLFPVPSVLLPKRQVLVVYATGGEADRAIKEKWHVQTGDWDVF